jgi:hypothetical protein
MADTMRDALDRLKAYGWRGELPDELGRVWNGRYQSSNAYHKDHSWDWEENRALLVNFRNMVSKYGTYVAMGYAVMANLVSDLYFRNPDPWIQDKRGNKDLSRILTAVFKAVHRDVNTERKMKEALFDTGWAGFGAIWISFDQEDHEEYVPMIDDETGEPLLDENGKVPELEGPDGEKLILAQHDENGQPMTKLAVDNQRIIEKRISPWRLRFDPHGTDWDLEDHRYLFVRFTKSLGDCISDRRFTKLGKQKLITWYSQRNANSPQNLQKISYAIMSDHSETDPHHLDVDLIEIWDRVTRTKIWMPEGAEFVLGTAPWDPCFAKANRFPVRIVAFNREPETEDGLAGFYPVPTVRLIKPQLYTINRLDSLFVEGNTHVVNKYITPEGLFSPTELTKLYTDKNRELITYDPKALSKLFAGTAVSPEMVKSLFILVPQQDAKELKHLEGIKHQFDVIAQIIGQSTGDRGGLAQASSATEALGLQQRLQQRLSEMRDAAGQHYNAITELMFLVLKSSQVLPIRYQMTTTFNEDVWAEFTADQWEELDLHFDYAVGSGAPRTREQEIALRQQVFQVAVPAAQALGDSRLLRWLTQMMVEPLDVRNAEQMFSDEASKLAQQLLLINKQIADHPELAADPRVAAQKQEIETALIEAVISTADLQQVAAAAAQGGGASVTQPEQTGQDTGTPASPVRSAGQQAAAMAAAGTVGGMTGA